MAQGQILGLQSQVWKICWKDDSNVNCHAFPYFIKLLELRKMDIRTHRGKLELTDKEGMSVRLDPEEVADLVGYLRIKLEA